jgi:prepilin-type N-terminal cleavage/methylation domain-containing protein
MSESKTQNSEFGIHHQELNLRLERLGFTLIELIVVLGVIGILIAILFPAVNMARTNARAREADVTATALANAITAFKTEYGYWPCPNPNAGGTFSSVAQQADIVDSYLVMGAPKNVNNIALWETRGCVTNWSKKPPVPFIITIDVTNNTVSVQ